MGDTSIEWTDWSQNVFRARLNGRTGHYCVKVSPGCKNCYSSRLQPRFGLPQFQEQRGEDAPEVYLDPKKLGEVLRRKKPTKIFWCDMTDMFGDWVPFEWVAACFGVMAATPQHTHQVLTKRPDRALEFFRWLGGMVGADVRTGLKLVAPAEPVMGCFMQASRVLVDLPGQAALLVAWQKPVAWPLPNVHLGVSCEDRRRADERIPLLLSCPAAVRWVSAEPLLESIDFQRIPANHAGAQWDMVEALTGKEYSDEELFPLDDKEDRPVAPRIDWVVVGGESGQRARPCDIGWIGDIVDQCRDAGVPVFVKQLGKRPVDGSVPVRVDSVIEPGFAMAGGGSAPVAYPIRSTKGGDPEEWPAELCVRMMPGEAWE